MRVKFMSLFATIVLVSLAFTSCETATNTNTNARNSNSSTNANTATNANAGNSNSSIWNANVSKEEYEKLKDRYESEAKRLGSKIGEGVDDMWLWTKIRASLLTTSDLRDSTINVDVINEVVTLKGTVASAAQKTKAETVAKGITGVKKVENQLTIKPSDSIANQAVNGNTKTSSNTKTDTNRKY